MKISAFDDEKEVIPEMNSGLKIKNKTQAKAPSIPLDEEISKHLKDKNLLQSKIAELSSKYMSCVRDKTISENRTSLEIKSEKDVVMSLVQYCLKLNSDETEPEGIGSIGLCSLLAHALLEHRNTINDLRYEIHNLKESIKSKNE